MLVPLDHSTLSSSRANHITNICADLLALGKRFLTLMVIEEHLLDNGAFESHILRTLTLRRWRGIQSLPSLKFVTRQRTWIFIRVVFFTIFEEFVADAIASAEARQEPYCKTGAERPARSPRSAQENFVIVSAIRGTGRIECLG